MLNEVHPHVPQHFSRDAQGLSWFHFVFYQARLAWPVPSSQSLICPPPSALRYLQRTLSQRPGYLCRCQWPILDHQVS